MLCRISARTFTMWQSTLDITEIRSWCRYLRSASWTASSHFICAHLMWRSNHSTPTPPRPGLTCHTAKTRAGRGGLDDRLSNTTAHWNQGAAPPWAGTLVQPNISHDAINIYLQGLGPTNLVKGLISCCIASWNSPIPCNESLRYISKLAWDRSMQPETAQCIQRLKLALTKHSISSRRHGLQVVRRFSHTESSEQYRNYITHRPLGTHTGVFQKNTNLLHLLFKETASWLCAHSLVCMETY